jgi:hypothetical protein
MMSLPIIHSCICADPRRAFQYPKFQALREVSLASIYLKEGLAEASSFLAYRALTPVKL